MAADTERVTWRVTLPGGWGTRLEPGWVPSDNAETWRRIFVGEDRAGRIFGAGGEGLPWRNLASAADLLSGVLEQYRQQLRFAEDEASSCERRQEHLTGIAAATSALAVPHRTHPRGRWRVRAQVDAEAVVLGEHDDVDLAEGDVAARCLVPDPLTCWAEPVSAGPAPDPLAHPSGWTPVVHPELRQRAFAVEDAVAGLCRAAASGHVGPDVLSTSVLCGLGFTVWRMICEYRVLFRAAWAVLDECPRAAAHNAAVQARLDGLPEADEDTPPGAWRHAALVTTAVGAVPAEISVHRTRAEATSSVAAHRATDEATIRWSEPITAGKRCSLAEVLA